METKLNLMRNYHLYLSSFLVYGVLSFLQKSFGIEGMACCSASLPPQRSALSAQLSMAETFSLFSEENQERDE